MKIKFGNFFPYGIKIKSKKQLCSEKSVERAVEPKRVAISLSQHIGAPATAIVKSGDKVKIGQLIGTATSPVSANVHASISGTVLEVTELTNGLGQKQTHVIIENDFSNEREFLPTLSDFSASSLKERVLQAGIVGLGGAGFPTNVKLSPKTKIDTLIINGAECEPYLNCDYRLMVEKTNEVYKGIKYLQTILGADKAIIGIEANKPKAIELFSNLNDVQVVVLKKQYPMGSEKHLIYCTTKRKVPLGKMPFDVGCCVQNVKTVLACYQAIEENIPLTHTVLTVSGNGVNTPKNLLAPIGTSFNHLLECCDGIKDNSVKIIAGGPMMGKTLANLEQYTKKTDSGILALVSEETDLSMPSNCINCAKCAKVCPMRLMPMYIESFILANDLVNAEKYGAMNCIECGCCAYGCPAKRPLVQSITLAKNKIREKKANEKR